MVDSAATNHATVKPAESALRPLITVFVLNWNRRDDLLQALESVRKQTYTPIEMLVVDNGSEDGSAEAVQQQYPEARLIRLDRNYGCPGGRNRGIVEASGEFIFFLDNDGLLHPEAVERAYKAICRDSRVAIVSAKTVHYQTGEERFLFKKNREHIDTSFFVPAFSGGASLHRSTIYRTVGLYPDDYMYGGEETDLALRVLDSGHLILYEPAAIMYHKILGSARNRDREFLHRCSNAMTTAWRLYPLEWAILHTFKNTTSQLKEAVRRRLVVPWLRDFPNRCRRVASAIRKRRPVHRRTLSLIRRLHRSVATSVEELGTMVPACELRDGADA